MAKILLVEDEKMVRDSLKIILTKEGYEIETAKDGVEALQMFRESPSDIVLTDILMPNKDGIEVIMELRKIKKECKIIAMSGGGRIGPDNYLKIAAKLGADEVLSKPIDLNILKSVIKGLLNQ